MSGTEGWHDEPSSSLLEEAALARVRAVLERRGGLVFGWHYFYAGGRDRSRVLFERFEDYREHLVAAAPGNHLTLYDADGVAGLAVVRLLTPADVTVLWRAVLECRSDAEMTVVRRPVPVPAAGATALLPAVVEVAADDDEHESGWDALRKWCQLPGCELLAFDTTFDCADNRLDADEEGETISTVTAGAGRRRVHARADGKRPDAGGRVPTNGPY